MFEYSFGIGMALLIWWVGILGALGVGITLYRRQTKNRGRSTPTSKLVILGLLALFAILYVYFHYFYQRV